ncbi:MAG: PEP-CTERM sorting domain-containing protein [Pirellulales bacterium]|nr:PEP-CTERM sorting domain-containing protein [Pirellulales bacterium]
MSRLLGSGLVVAALLVFLAAPVSAAVHYDDFTASIAPDGVVTGGGTGWNDGEFVYYPLTGWYNEWFYDDPPDPTRWKWITYDISVVPGPTLDPDRIIEIAINWSTMLYPENPAQPPLYDASWTLPYENDLIVRHTIYEGPVTEAICLRSLEIEPNGQIIIPDFNPEWVSIDIRQIEDGDPGILEPITLVGCITHACVPEPSTVVMLLLGVLGLMIARRR